jgi:4-oxalocrotonate tautomerase family enzyme
MPTVIVYWSPGRTEEQKRRVARRMAQALVEDGGARPEDVLIIFQHIEAGNTARGRDLLNPGESSAAQPVAENDTGQKYGP